MDYLLLYDNDKYHLETHLFYENDHDNHPNQYLLYLFHFLEAHILENHHLKNLKKHLFLNLKLTIEAQYVNDMHPEVEGDHYIDQNY